MVVSDFEADNYNNIRIVIFELGNEIKCTTGAFLLTCIS